MISTKWSKVHRMQTKVFLFRFRNAKLIRKFQKQRCFKSAWHNMHKSIIVVFYCHQVVQHGWDTKWWFKLDLVWESDGNSITVLKQGSLGTYNFWTLKNSSFPKKKKYFRVQDSFLNFSLETNNDGFKITSQPPHFQYNKWGREPQIKIAGVTNCGYVGSYSCGCDNNHNNCNNCNKDLTDQNQAWWMFYINCIMTVYYLILNAFWLR